MKLQRHGTLACLAISATLALAACGSDNASKGASGGASAAAPTGNCASGTLNGAGSTAQKNAMSEWVKAYQSKCSGAQINYNANGSGAGIQAFTAKTADWAGSDSALKDTEQPAADKRCGTGKAIHLPMVTGPIAVAFNVSGVDNLQLKPATIAGIFAGKIKTWNDAAIKADNPGVTLPSTAVQPVHRSDASGTTDNFTKFLAATAKDTWTYGNAKEWKAPGGVGAKGSDGVSALISKTPGTIGYVEYSFVQIAGLKAAKVANGSGEFVQLTPDAAGKAVESAEVTGQGDDLKLKIDYNTKAAGAYPLVLVTYEIACESGNGDKANLLKSFLTYTSSAEGQSQLTQLGYAPLPESVRSKVADAASKIAS